MLSGKSFNESDYTLINTNQEEMVSKKINI